MNIDKIKELDITERIMLVEDIWDSIAQEQDKVKLSDYEKQILDQRLKAHEKNPDNLISWDKIKSKLKS